MLIIVPYTCATKWPISTSQHSYYIIKREDALSSKGKSNKLEQNLVFCVMYNIASYSYPLSTIIYFISWLCWILEFRSFGVATRTSVIFPSSDQF